MRPSVVLVRPPVDVLHKFSKPVECLALGYLAASARAGGGEATLVDGMLHDWTVEETARRTLEARPAVVGITTVLNHLPATVRPFVRLLREGGFGGPVILGGHAVSFFPERILDAGSDIDGVVVGEGEVAMQDIVTALASGSDWRDASGMVSRSDGGVCRRAVSRVHDLDLLSPPARDLVPDIIELDGLVAISTSRGCYARCSFCSVPRFYGLSAGRPFANGAWLARSVDGVVAEISDLYARFGVLELLVVDDEFFGGTEAGRDRAFRFAEQLAALRLPLRFALSCRAENAEVEVLCALRDAGLAHVFVGLEAGTNADLKLYAKGIDVDVNERAVSTIKSLGLTFQPGFMLFNHRSTLAGIRENLRFLRRIGECKPTTIASAVDPHFGAPLTKQMERDGVLVDDGLSLRSVHPDARICALQAIADDVAVAARPFVETVAALQSAVTYEWRRRPPGRTVEGQRLVDAFERLVNDVFSTVVVEAVDSLLDRASIEDVVATVGAALRRAEERAAVVRAAVVLKLDAVEESVRYHSQRDLMEAR